MKVPLPLSLKISLWLFLNLLVLGVAAVVLLLMQGGLSWNALVRGTAGDRWQNLARTLASDVSAVDDDSADSVLEEAGDLRGVQFVFFRNDGHQIAGTPTQLPEQVLSRLMAPPPRQRGARRPPSGSLPEENESVPPRSLEARRIAPAQMAQGRFLIRTDDPRLYFLAARVPFGRDRPVRATLIAVADSWWGMMRLLDLQPWFTTAGIVLGISILFWMPPVLGITRNLRRLTVATENIAEGHFDTRVVMKRSDELGSLGESINSMAARLDTLVNGQRRFLGDVAHELASPIGRMQVALGILERCPDPTIHRQLGDVREEVQQMSDLVNELLTFTRAGLQPRDASLAPVALTPVVAEALAREDINGRVTGNVPDMLTVLADAQLLMRAVANLIRNALRYSAEGDPITIDARKEHDEVVLSVEDCGPGVPEEAIARLGEPFFRPESARSRETGGVGLGLAIVRSAVSACGGEIKFSNRAGGGFRAEIRLKHA